MIYTQEELTKCGGQDLFSKYSSNKIVAKNDVQDALKHGLYTGWHSDKVTCPKLTKYFAHLQKLLKLFIKIHIQHGCF